MIEFFRQPWPWYVVGPLMGLMVPAFLILGNKPFGISPSLKHICAACLPAGIPFFRYAWKKELWNLVFAAGILAGAFIAGHWLTDYNQLSVHPKLTGELHQYSISAYGQLVPGELIGWNSLFSLKGFVLTVAGGFLVGFGSRYADGCTSGHSIMGLSNLQWPSLVATCCFMIGGFLAANFIVPLILKL